jgi:hypothetical protein
VSALLLADAKTHLNMSASTNDAELQAVIDAAEAVLARRVGPLEPAATTDRVIGLADSLVVRTVPAVSLTSITGPSGSALDLTNIHLEQGSGVITHNLGQYFVERYYTVAYSAGRASCPDDLLLAVKELVRHVWQTQRGSGGRPGSAPVDVSSTPGLGYYLPYRVQELIAPHLQPGFA